MFYFAYTILYLILLEHGALAANKDLHSYSLVAKITNYDRSH
jgi:hypothetical protein